MVPTRLPAVGAPSIAFANRIQRMHEQGRITDTQAKIALHIAIDARLPWERAETNVEMAYLLDNNILSYLVRSR
jgi:predicted component of type VI protein secretion system